MSKVVSTQNHEVQLAAFLIGRLVGEGVCIGAYKTLIFDAAVEAANELSRQEPKEVEFDERFALITEKALIELRSKINRAAKDGGANIASLSSQGSRLDKLRSDAPAAEVAPAKALTIANMRSLGVTAIEATCECGRQMVVEVSGLPGAIEVPALRRLIRCLECGERPNEVRPDWTQFEPGDWIDGRVVSSRDS